MRDTYTIHASKPGTVFVTKRSLDCICKIAPRMDGTVGLVQSGNLLVTEETVLAAIRLTLEDRQDREVVIGEPNAPIPADDDVVTKAMTLNGHTY